MHSGPIPSTDAVSCNSWKISIIFFMDLYLSLHQKRTTPSTKCKNLNEPICQHKTPTPGVVLCQSPHLLVLCFPPHSTNIIMLMQIPKFRFKLCKGSVYTWNYFVIELFCKLLSISLYQFMPCQNFKIIGLITVRKAYWSFNMFFCVMFHRHRSCASQHRVCPHMMLSLLQNGGVLKFVSMKLNFLYVEGILHCES